MKQEQAIEKIKKCLALSKSSNANEAAIAIKQAQKLMDQYNITDIDIDASQCNDAFFNTQKRPPLWMNRLANITSDAFGCELILVHALFDGAYYKFIGPGVNPELAEYAFAVIYRQIKRDRANYIKTRLKRCKRTTKTIRADAFCESWVYAVSDKITAFTKSEAVQNSIDAYLQKNHPNLKTSNTKSRTHKNGSKIHDRDLIAGHQAGKNANLNRGVNTNEQAKLQ